MLSIQRNFPLGTHQKKNAIAYYLILKSSSIFLYMIAPKTITLLHFCFSLINRQMIRSHQMPLNYILSPGIPIWITHCGWSTTCRSKLLSFSANNSLVWLFRKQGLVRTKVNKGALTQTCCLILALISHDMMRCPLCSTRHIPWMMRQVPNNSKVFCQSLSDVTIYTCKHSTPGRGLLVKQFGPLTQFKQLHMHSIVSFSIKTGGLLVLHTGTLLCAGNDPSTAL